MSEDALVLPDAREMEITVVLAGLASIQVQALSVGDIGKVNAAGNSFGKLAEENSDQVRDALLRNQEAFSIAAMPDEILDQLDLEMQDGTLYEATDDEDWAEVDIDE